ncbi:glycerol dehydrogenase [Bacillota bacterium LX-D]|nr:glycerol dehydrogenase [Bacillota bacterium LX-D]
MIRVLISPGKYVQGAGALGEIEKHIKSLGANALIISDPFMLSTVDSNLVPRLSSIKHGVEKFNGECSKTEINRLQEVAKKQNADIILGFGGGKTLDTAKAVAYYAKLPVVVIPTIASTDAPCSALSVIYTETGEFAEYLMLPKNPDVVLLDTTIIAKAPSRFLVAGMGDALATKFEAGASAKAYRSAMSGGLPTFSALALADLCYQTLLEYGLPALEAVEHNAVTPAVEKIVEANTLLSGLGFESGGLAAAHAIHNGFTTLEQTHHYYHGEKVAFSTIVQLVLEDRATDEIMEVIEFCHSVGLPITLKELGIEEVKEDELMKVAEVATVQGETIHNLPFPVEAKMVYNAILGADALGQLF